MTTPSNALMLRPPPELMAERMAVAGFLAGYTGSTRNGYATDLRIFTHWLNEHGLGLFDVQRAHLELDCPDQVDAEVVEWLGEAASQAD